MAASRLPGHIIEGVAHWVSPLHSEKADARPLVPLAGVCGAWRNAVLPLLFRTASLETNSGGARQGGRRTKTLQQAVASGCQRHIRHAAVHVRDLDASQTWEAQEQDTAALLLGCGQLPAVRSVSFGFFVGDAEVRTEALVRRAADALGALVSAVVKTMPGIRRVVISGKPPAYSASAARQSYLDQEQRLFEQAFDIVGAQTTQLDVVGWVAAGRLPASLAAGPLKSLTIAGADTGQRHGAELVRRNSATLERLQVSEFYWADIDTMLFGDGRRGQPVIYPRLKRLLVCSPYDDEDQDHAVLDANPFPSLEELRCDGCRSFPTAFVALESRARLRRLAVRLDSGAIEALLGSAAAARGGFPCVDVAEVGRLYQERTPASVSRLVRLLRLFGHARAAAIIGGSYRLSGEEVEECGALRLSPDLQSLDMWSVKLTVDQAAATFRAHPRLHTAKILLTDFPADTDREQAASELLGARVSGVSRLSLHLSAVKSVGRAGELVLLLAGALPAGARVSLRPMFMLPVEGILDAIQRARCELPHRNNPRLGSMVFLKLG